MELNMGACRPAPLRLEAPPPMELNMGACRPAPLRLEAPPPMELNMGACRPAPLRLEAPPPMGLTMGACRPAPLRLEAPPPMELNMGACRPAPLRLEAPPPMGLTMGACRPAPLRLEAPPPMELNMGACRPAPLRLEAPPPMGLNMGACRPAPLRLEAPPPMGLNMGACRPAGPLSGWGRLWRLESGDTASIYSGACGPLKTFSHGGTFRRERNLRSETNGDLHGFAGAPRTAEAKSLLPVRVHVSGVPAATFRNTSQVQVTIWQKKKTTITQSKNNHSGAIMTHVTKSLSDVRNVILSAHRNTSAVEKIAFYDAWARNYDQDVGILDYRAPLLAAERLSAEYRGDRTTAALLDVACGTGLVGWQLQKMGFCNFVGVDGSHGMLDIARAKGLYQELKQCMLGTEPLPFEAESYDAVLIVGAFGVGSVPVSVVKELWRVAKPGGYVCMTTRSDKNNLEYKAQLEDMMGVLEQDGMWVKVDVTEVEQWERAVSHQEVGYISGVVYLYRKSLE